MKLMNNSVYTDTHLLPNDNKSTIWCNQNMWNLCRVLL